MAFVLLILGFFIDFIDCGGYLISIAYFPFFFIVIRLVINDLNLAFQNNIAPMKEETWGLIYFDRLDEKAMISTSTSYPRHQTEKEHKQLRRHKVILHKWKAKRVALAQQMATRLS